MQDFSYLRDPYHPRNRDVLRHYPESLETTTRKRRMIAIEAIKALGYMILLVVLVIAAITTTERINEPSAEYCEMTALFLESRGEFGWPDFDKNAHLCTTP
jgi:hypothetical protein